MSDKDFQFDIPENAAPGTTVMDSQGNVGFSVFQHGQAALISFTSGRNRLDDDYGKVQTVTFGQSKMRIKQWGADNILPDRRESLLCGSNIVPTLIATKRDITIGAGIYTFEKIIEDGTITKKPVDTPSEIRDFLDRLDDSDYWECAGNEYFKHANVFPEIIPTKGGQIYTFKVQECRHVRASEGLKDGHIKQFWIHPNWGELNGKRSSNTKAEDRVEAKPVMAYLPGAEIKPNVTTIYHIGDKLLRPDGYYYSPAYWGGRVWIDLANAIPEFHRANLLNSYSLKYHIEIPRGYFRKAASDVMTDAQREELLVDEENARTEFLRNINKFLAGIHNTGRTIWSEYEINKALGKDFPGIKITPIKADMNDKALLELFEKSNQANISAQAVHPTLASLETPGKLGSGSEMRNAFLAHVAIKTPQPRRTLLKPLYLAKKINGWDPKIEFGFLDMEITKLDENITGIQLVQNNAE